MALNEADTRAKLIDPALHSRGWTEDSIKREVTAGAIEIVAGIPRQRAADREDLVLRPVPHRDKEEQPSECVPL